MKLSYVQLDGHGVHDPALDVEPSPETRRTRFKRDGDYDLTLTDGVVAVVHRPSARCTLVSFAQCRFAVLDP